MATVKVHVLTHGYCFDGMASGVLFTRLLGAIERGRDLEFSYRSCGYGPKLKTIPKGWLAGDQNAILDFRYTENDRLTYYFDHHRTAFASDSERVAAESNVAASRGKRALHYDPSCSSCAKLIARVAAEVHGESFADLSQLIEWADRVDAARFDDPEEAFFARTPALLVADVVERHGDTAFLNKLVPKLCRTPLEDVAASEEIVALASPLAAAKEAFITAVRRVGKMQEDVAVVDLGDVPITPAGKFATYVAFPRCRYSVILLRTKDQLKLGVGWNPWGGAERLHDISALCRAEGGGGHPVVGAVNFAHEQMDAARAAFTRMVAALQAR